ncbi:hypothetical protein E2C01_053235 [Portunus trituberculatus]|uniref:Uncharacterized protein n=1 Tax=Portunus trituberculatus TaxID=210409 RepID=A0A5B7GFV5_PORTR|nr:hypothetical protein [Portunus trituberculatus]
MWGSTDSNTLKEAGGRRSDSRKRKQGIKPAEDEPNCPTDWYQKITQTKGGLMLTTGDTLGQVRSWRTTLTAHPCAGHAMCQPSR